MEEHAIVSSGRYDMPPHNPNGKPLGLFRGTRAACESRLSMMRKNGMCGASRAYRVIEVGSEPVQYVERVRL